MRGRSCDRFPQMCDGSQYRVEIIPRSPDFAPRQYQAAKPSASLSDLSERKSRPRPLPDK
jgi:hypothetical protein